jgi:hypothetical protein
MGGDFIKKRKEKKKKEAKKDKEADEAAFEKSRTGLLSLASLDFAIHTLYVNEECIHTRTDGKKGVYIKLKTFDKSKLGFVPIRNVKSEAESLKQQIPKLLANADQTDTEIKAIEADLEMFDEDWDLAKKVKAQASIQQLSHKLTVQKSLIDKKKRKLAQEEEKGICIRYSLVDSEGYILTKDDIWNQKVKISKRELKSESENIIAQSEKIKFESQCKLQNMNIITRKTQSNLKLIDDLEIASLKKKIKEDSRGDRSEIRIF